MEWSALTLVIPIARWTKKRLDIATLERRVLAREKAVEVREVELDELIKIRDANIEHLSDLVSLEVSSMNYVFGQIQHVCEIQFTVTNRSIFDITLTRFTAKPQFQGSYLSPLSDVDEHEVKKQSATNFYVVYNLQEVTVKLISTLIEQQSRTRWHFEMTGYFRSNVGDFEKTAGNGITV